jgi:sugar phosphate isomerase/epimerase
VNFGIMAMQLNELIPSDKTPGQIMGDLASFDHSVLVGRLAESGFRWIELGGDLGLFLPNAFSPEAVQKLKSLKEDGNFDFTVHLPLWSIEPSSPSPHVRAGSVDALTSSIQATLPLEPTVYVMHATGALAAEFFRMRLPDVARSVILRQFQANALQSLKEILDKTGISPRRIAVETIEFPFEMTIELAEWLDLSICLDTGHILVGFSGEIELFEALQRCAPRLAEIHLHDGPSYGKNRQIGYGKDHQALGKGDLDIKRLLIELKRMEFQGPVIFELAVREAIESMRTVQRIQSSIKSASSDTGGLCAS